MAKKEISGYVKLQIKGGQANPAPPVGPALGQRGINIMEFCKAFNEKTKNFMGKPVPVIITVYKDKKFDFIIKSPPASHFIREAAKLKSGSKEPGRVIAGSITMKQAEKAKISEKIEEIVVPTHDVTEVKRGKRIQRKKKYFPGYVLIKSEMDNNIYHMIKNIKKVSGFLGSRGSPIPVSDKEVEKIMGQIKDGVAQPKSAIEYNIGEKVQVIDGPFASFSGMVEDIDEEKLRLKVSVSIFGRPTPVDLEYNQVEKAS